MLVETGCWQAVWGVFSHRRGLGLLAVIVRHSTPSLRLGMAIKLRIKANLASVGSLKASNLPTKGKKSTVLSITQAFPTQGLRDDQTQDAEYP